MSDRERIRDKSAAAMKRQIESVGRLAASTVLVEHELTAALREITEVAACPAVPRVRISLVGPSRAPDLKVLFMSGYTADVLERHGRPDDVFDIMKKPFMLNELAQRIRETLDS